MAHKRVIKSDRKFGMPPAVRRFTTFELPELKAMGKAATVVVCEAKDDKGQLCDFTCHIKADGTHTFEFVKK